MDDRKSIVFLFAALAAIGLDCGFAWAQTVTTLASFDGANTGALPNGGLYRDAAGNLYGTTFGGGASNVGVVFEYVAATHALTNLASLDFATTGARPNGYLVADAGGNLFGTTQFGGITGFGSVFEISAGSHQYNTILSLAYPSPVGADPRGGIALDSGANIFGVNSIGGFNNGQNAQGTLYRLANDGTGNYTFQQPRALVTFTGPNGGSPIASLTPGPDGNFYGTTLSGGPNGFGSVFQYAVASHTLNTLASFDDTHGGQGPSSPVTLDAAGNVYGVVGGQAFEIDAATHNFTIIANLPIDGTPTSGLTFDASGNLYGTTNSHVYKIDGTTHDLSILATMTSPAGGPIGGVVVDGDVLYGVTSGGGDFDSGTLYQIHMPEPTSAALLSFALPLVLRRKRRLAR